MTHESLRLDKWLWHARFFKSRSLAKARCESRKIRVNGDLISKASRTVTPGDTLTFPYQDGILVLEIVALGTRRGPAPEAQALYNIISAPEKPKNSADKSLDVRPVMLREKGSGRPTKRERRALDRLITKAVDD